MSLFLQTLGPIITVLLPIMACLVISAVKWITYISLSERKLVRWLRWEPTKVLLESAVIFLFTYFYSLSVLGPNLNLAYIFFVTVASTLLIEFIYSLLKGFIYERAIGSLEADTTKLNEKIRRGSKRRASMTQKVIDSEIAYLTSQHREKIERIATIRREIVKIYSSRQSGRLPYLGSLLLLAFCVVFASELNRFLGPPFIDVMAGFITGTFFAFVLAFIIHHDQQIRKTIEKSK